MRYLGVAVASNEYHGKEPLTYSSETNVKCGSIVFVPLRSKSVIGVVVSSSEIKPNFAVKSIINQTKLPIIGIPQLKLLAWMQGYYASSYGSVAPLFLPTTLSKRKTIPEPDSSPSDITHISHKPLPPLTSSQSQALQTITDPGSYMLHGETGSGKTRVYIELARKCINSGKSAIILTPEIGLTSQLMNSFLSIFGAKVMLVHSRLTESSRLKLWLRIAGSSEPIVVIGARSALFSPVHKLGLVVIDEEHDSAYKQDSAPYYQTTRVAAKLTQLTDSILILGSATPLVVDYYLAKAYGRPILRMKDTAIKSQKSIVVTDLRDRSNFTKSSYLSNTLLELLRERLQDNEQSLLFLNRRGTARVVFCEKCGWQSLCPRCDIALIYHGDSHHMRCHSCEYSANSPVSCPSCHNPSIVFKSIGTKAIVDEIHRIFPDAKVMRFDTDNKKDERLENHFEDIERGDVDILVGTQTLTKGLDLPKLSLVGVIIADTSLLFPDFSAQERTYQLLSQVIGRVGRGHREGKVVIQTYQPDSNLLASVIDKDWEGFYETELTERKAFLFPPYCHLLKLTCKRSSYKNAEKAAAKLASFLVQEFPRVRVEGPAPAFREKVHDKFQWQVIVKAKQRTHLLTIINQLPSGWTYDIDPTDLL